MTDSISQAAPPRQTGRSILAVLVGLAVNIVVALVIDTLFHQLGVYPPWGQPMPDAGDNALALSYRLIIGVLSGYVTARLAPSAPMRHAIILGIIGFVLSLIGTIVGARLNLGPLWYPLALVVTAIPCAWLGGTLAARRR